MAAAMASSASAPALLHGEGQASSSATSPPRPHPYLTRRFQVGGASKERNSYQLEQKIFHASSVPPEARETKQAVQHSKKANILGTEPRVWNASTLTIPRGRKEKDQELKRKLLQVRAGLLDEKVMKQSKSHSDEEIRDRTKYLVSLTGQGPVGRFSKQWMNSSDERGLCNHCTEDTWSNWNDSTSANTKDDVKQAQGRFHEQEERRMRHMAKESKHNAEAYVDPVQGVRNVNAILRERKIDYQELKDQFKMELKREFPQASEERLQAMAQRLLKEKLAADEKAFLFPVRAESNKPNLSLTTQDRRYKVYNHPGTWAWSEAEKRHAWSCCFAFDEGSRGCEYKVVNPDAWCLEGFERRS
eukprot:TRINITY_DN77297_c0_g1_i1.p1 TRINITY_DN77297_c0_g1~~TRINITY_DN77297_c0_g1_i1.p1  ORF type:complete len:359 (-),score=71.72 TRINITY_DN77297_c0_g1_i1:56-1132(-)